MKKDLTSMTTSELNALLKVASDKKKAAIQAELDRRNETTEPAAPAVQGEAEGQEYVDPDHETTPEEEAAYAEAEANGGKLGKAKRMTDEEIDALTKELRTKYVGHKCEVVVATCGLTPVPGYIKGIQPMKSVGKPYFMIMLDSGRQVTKAYDSNLVQIFDEVVNAATVTPQGRRKQQLSDAEIAEIMAGAASNVGKAVTFTDGFTGRIVGVVFDKRANACLYRISKDIPSETNPDAFKLVHKVHDSKEITIEPEFDEKGQSMNDAYMARRNREPVAKPVISPEERLMKATEALKKAQAAVEKANENLAVATQKYESAKMVYEAAKAAEGTPEGETEGASESTETQEAE